MQKQRLGFVDALRGIAILLVIGAHAGVVTGLVGLAGGLANLGGYGVQLFFVVSAFTIFLTLERARARETFSIRNFFIRRLFRIVPVYWMGILLYSALYHLQSRGWTAAPFAWHFPLHILLINSLVPSAQSSVVPGGWSISCEVLFYITVPLWFFLIRSVRGAIIFTVLSIVVGWGLTQGLSGMSTAWLAGSPDEVVRSFWYRIIFNQLGCFSFGCLLYFILKSSPPPPTHTHTSRGAVADLDLSLAIWPIDRWSRSGFKFILSFEHRSLPRSRWLHDSGIYIIARSFAAVGQSIYYYYGADKLLRLLISFYHIKSHRFPSVSGPLPLTLALFLGDLGLRNHPDDPLRLDLLSRRGKAFRRPWSEAHRSVGGKSSPPQCCDKARINSVHSGEIREVGLSEDAGGMRVPKSWIRSVRG